MSKVLTAWRLAKAGRQRVQCIVSERDGRWRVIVQEGRHITFAERCASDDAALARAHDIWHGLIERGWTDPTH